ncbi:MAG: malto-oligosyltrehalose synthase [Gemmatimonadota bacterium]
MSDETPPRATYRLQLHGGFRLDDARAQVPYLSQLGVSHVYASPLLAARPGSTHGYDVVDPTRLNPELGDESAFAVLTDALQREGMGLVLDIVPNHMAAASANPYWEDLLRHGRASAYAGWFDVDWEAGEGRTRGRVLLPVLGTWLPATLAAGELGLARAGGEIRVRYFNQDFPLDPATLPRILDAAPSESDDSGVSGARGDEARELAAVAADLRALPAREPESAGLRAEPAERALRRLAELVDGSAAARARVDRALRAFGGPEGAPRLRRLLDAQAYALVHWRRAREEVNYRRFFDVNELVALRAEDPDVFRQTHARVLEWVAQGRVQGLRVDHVDGLLDPRGYLERLREALQAASAAIPEVRGNGLRSGEIPVFVEKILGTEERLPDWPVSGTTGYEFLNQLEAALLDPDGAAVVEQGYRAVTGRTHGFAAAARRGKRGALLKLLATDVLRLALRLRRLAPRAADTPRPGRADLADAIVESIVHLAVYRTYLDGRPGSPSPADRRLLDDALAAARAGGRASGAALDLLAHVLLGGEGAPGDGAGRLAFTLRFQQTSGPAAAKGVEDTALYVHVPLLSRNEVGGAPDLGLAGALERLHAANLERARRWPATLLCTTTHDTKRSADVRARLDVLSEVPREWLAGVARWRRWNRSLRRRIGSRLAPDANTEYLVYQTLLGVWPLMAPAGAAAGSVAAAGGAEDLVERLVAYTRKAAREARTHTSWIDPDAAFEEALEEFVRALLADGGSPFLMDMHRLCRRVARPGLWNALARTLAHLAAPGVPDLYQGDELWNFALVDPDNRRPVDFARRQRCLGEVEAGFAAGGQERRAFLRRLVEAPEDGRVKLHVVRRALAARTADPELFTGGDYLPLAARGERARHVLAFARRRGRRIALAVVPRLPATLLADPARAPLGRDVWGDTELMLPRALAGGDWLDALSGAAATTTGAGGALALGDLLEHLPAALVIGTDARYGG